MCFGAAISKTRIGTVSTLRPMVDATATPEIAAAGIATSEPAAAAA